MHVDFVEDNESWADRALTGALGGDCYGHGTAVASLAAGRFSVGPGRYCSPRHRMSFNSRTRVPNACR